MTRPASIHASGVSLRYNPSIMEFDELADGVLPSDTYASLTYDEESAEVGIQYGYALISIPREDLPDLIQLLQDAQEELGDIGPS